MPSLNRLQKRHERSQRRLDQKNRPNHTANSQESYRKPGQPLGMGKTAQTEADRIASQWYPGKAEMAAQRELYTAATVNGPVVSNVTAEG